MPLLNVNKKIELNICFLKEPDIMSTSPNTQGNIDHLNSLLDECDYDSIDLIFEESTPFKSVNMNTFIESYLLSLKKYSFEEPDYKNKNISKYFKNINKHYVNEYITSKQFNDFIDSLSSTVNGHIFLYNLKDKMKENKTDYIDCILSTACSGTLSNLMFWIKEVCELFNVKDVFKLTILSSSKLNNFTNSKVFNNYGFAKNFVLACLSNNDDRIFNFTIKNINTWKQELSSNIETIIVNIFTPTRPNKYKLRRLKLLSPYINFVDNFPLMIKYFTGDFYTFQKIYKFYKKDENYLLNPSINIYNIYLHIFHNMFENKNISEISEIYLKLYNILETPLEKNILVLNLILFIMKDHFYSKDPENIINLHLLFSNYKIKFKYIDDKLTKDLICMKKNIFDKIDLLTCNFNSVNTPKIINFLTNFIEKNDITNEFIKCYYYDSWGTGNNFCKNCCYILPYLNYNEKLKSINLVLFYLKVFIRTFKKKKQIIKTFRMRQLLNEIKNLKKLENKAVFKINTYNNSLTKQKFNSIPPYSLFPNQIQKMNYPVFVKEKIDGVMVNKIVSKNIHPNFIFNDIIKAEYVEDLDLYLVFDIDIDMPIEDRYKYLRNIHPNTKDFVNIGVNIKDKIDRERVNLYKFLDEDYDSYRWYPKAAFKIDTKLPEFKKFIIDIINDDNRELHKWLCNDRIINDGLILTPINGNREIKVKPKSLLTIDLKYINGQWIDNDKKCYNNIVTLNNTIELTNDSIWRLYPIGDKYIPREIRYDKTNPNPRSVVNILISQRNSKFNLDSKEEIYFTNKKFTFNIFWNEVTKENKSSIIKMLKNHTISKTWLDLGCGNGKNIKLLPKYKSYYGIDFDMNQLVRCIERFNDKNNIFNYLNLSIDWNDTTDRWLSFEYIKYDNILAVNSLMHFCTEEFWHQLNLVSKKGSIFTFNLLNYNIDEKHNGNWKKNNCYLTKKDSKINYYFDNIHKKVMNERFIGKDELYSYLKKYDWSIVNEFTNEENELTNLYTWYSVIKN